MSIVDHSTKSDNHLQANGMRWIRHSFVDHLGITHAGAPKLVDGTWGTAEFLADRIASIPRVEAALSLREELEARDRVSLGEDALVVANDFKHSTQKKIAKHLVYWMMEESDPKIVIRLEPLLTYINGTLTDLQIQNFLDITPQQLANMREKVKQILNVPDPCQAAQDGILAAEAVSEVIDNG